MASADDGTLQSRLGELWEGLDRCRVPKAVKGKAPAWPLDPRSRGAGPHRRAQVPTP